MPPVALRVMANALPVIGQRQRRVLVKRFAIRP
jgi:hypothetical protein